MLRIFIILFLLIGRYGFGQSVMIDHIITLTPQDNYHAVVESYRKDGFSIKAGHPHDNGLLNNHIKFSNGSSLELITLTSTPSDVISQIYARLMSEQEQAVFIALKIDSAKETSELLTGKGIQNELMINKLWNYVTFPNGSGMELFFLIEMKTTIKDEPSIYGHDNGAKGFYNIFISGGEVLKTLLNELGLKNEELVYPDFGKCTTYNTQTGNLVIINSKVVKGRPETLKLNFLNSDQVVGLDKDFE